MRKRMCRVLALLLAFTVSLWVFPIGAVGEVYAASKGKVKSVKVTNLPAKQLTLKKGKSKKLKVKVSVSGKASKKVKYKSSNKKIVKVSKKGVVKGVKKGTAKITVTSVGKPNKKTVIKVTVGTPVKSVKLDRSSIISVPGEKAKLKATVKPSKASSKKIVWKSSNKKVVKVDKKGNLTFVKAGKATITATAADGSGKKATCKVEVAQKRKSENNDPLPVYSVSFESNGGAPVESQDVTDGSYAVPPENPVKDGYVFKGWYSDSELSNSYDFARRVRSSMTLYAGWDEESYDYTEYTRAEWIAMLANMMEMNLNADPEKIVYHFADTQDIPEGIAIETAYAYGIVPDYRIEDEEQDVPVFEPNELATREFAAYTASRAVGFDQPTENVPACNDSSELQYSSEVWYALENDIMRLKDGYFYPSDPLTDNDVQIIRNAIARILESEIVEPNEAYDNSEYAENVLKDEIAGVKDYTIIENSDNTFTVTTAKSNALSKALPGDTIVLAPNGKYPQGVPLKVLDNGVSGSKRILTCSEPELEDVYNVIDFAGQATALTNKISAADGVDVTYNANGSIDSGSDSENNIQTMRNINVGGSHSLPGKLTFDVKKVELSDKLTLKGSVEVEIPDITCILDADVGILSGIDVNEFTFSLTEKVQLKGDLEYQLAESGYELTNAAGKTRFVSGRKELGRVPFAIGTTGLSVDLVFFVNVDIKGNITITYTIVGKEGFQFKNGSPRIIKDFSDSLDFLAVKGSGSITLGAALDLAVGFGVLHGFDIIGVTIDIGPAVEVSFTPHVLATQSLYCGDAHLYATSKITLDQETVVGKFLKDVRHYTLEKELLKNDRNNPLRIGLHIENGNIVNACTFGTGGVSGRVVDAVTGSAINGGRVQVYLKEGSTEKLIRSRFTGNSGRYSIDNLEGGTYRISIAANHYARYEMQVTVQDNQMSYLETARMIARSGDMGDLLITVVDARTGEQLDNYKYYLREGSNNTTGNVVKTGESAVAECLVELKAGYYTLQVSKDGYGTSQKNVTVSSGTESNGKVVMKGSSSTGNSDAALTVIMSWSDTPSDLDSHMFGPGVADSQDTFHTWFSNKDYYGNSDQPIANLDLDDTDGIGPETTSVYTLQTGKYDFYVHDYSNKGETGSYELSDSGATVEVFIGDVKVKEYYVPSGKEGTLWHVFTYNPSTNVVTDVNTVTNDESAIGETSNDNDYEDEYNEDDIDTLDAKENASESAGEDRLSESEKYYKKIEADLIRSVREAPQKASGF